MYKYFVITIYIPNNKSTIFEYKKGKFIIDFNINDEIITTKYLIDYTKSLFSNNNFNNNNDYIIMHYTFVQHITKIGINNIKFVHEFAEELKCENGNVIIPVDTVKYDICLIY